MNHALVIAGGSGTRLWPMSQGDTPKQLIPLIGGRSLLELAFERVAPLFAPEHRHVCAGRRHEQAIRSLLPWLGKRAYIAEPVGRDTLNAIGLAAMVLLRDDPDATLAVLTADHVIRPPEAFCNALADALALVAREPQRMVTFGVVPTHPETGYGYLELGDALPGTPGAHKVTRFREKPDLQTATGFFDAGPARYLWNAGMFVWKARTFVERLAQFAPENHAGLERIVAHWGTPEGERLLETLFPTLPKISVDYGVMEPASRLPDPPIVAIKLPVSWLDIGSWSAFGMTCPEPDARGNRASCVRAHFDGADNVLIVADDPDHVIAAVGVQDLIIVRTRHATLVCKRSDEQNVKRVAQALEQPGP